MGSRDWLLTTRSSIGFDVPYDIWKTRFIDSKLCLAIRGDNPATHAVLRSVRVGCIPVVISDSLPRYPYSPTLKSTIHLTDYTIMVDETSFLKDPAGVLLNLLTQNNITSMIPISSKGNGTAATTSTPTASISATIQNKIQELQFAQRIIFPDHPQSLFVEAFLKECWLSIPLEMRNKGIPT